MTEKKLPDEVVDALLEGYTGPEDLLGKDGLLQELTRRLLERALEVEMRHHVGYGREESREEKRQNTRNGASRKRVLTENGEVEVSIPRDREGSFEPILVPKHVRRLKGFDERVLGMYARGMTTGEIQEFVAEQYGIEISRGMVSDVTDAVTEEVKEWQNRPLESLYAVVFFDALRVKIRDEGQVKNKAVYLALGYRLDGTREILGLWIEQTEGARFWLRVMNELKNRGVADILIAVVDGLKGFPETITTVFPETEVQTCIVHLLRNSLEFVNHKDKSKVVEALRTIYRAPSAEAAAQELDYFAASELGAKYPPIVALWRRHWEQVIPFLAYPQEIRKLIYTTNALESVHMRLRKIAKSRGHFPSDEAATKLLYLVIRNMTKKWGKPVAWHAALTQFAILFADRIAAVNR